MSTAAIVIIINNPKGKKRANQIYQKVEIEVKSDFDLTESDILRAAADELEDRDG